MLLTASVGAGKSLMIADILLTIQNKGKKALCIVNNSELVRNNKDTFVEQGGRASIYCAALGEKDDTESVIFGTPQSILNAIKRKERLANEQFSIIVVDEAHNINYDSSNSTFIHKLNIIEKKKVTNVSKKNPPDKFVCVSLRYGVIILTPEHPIYVINKGYTKAHSINKGDLIYVDRSYLHDMSKTNKNRKSPKASIKK